MQLTDRRILVTGGTSGIGRALAEALHDRGNRVVVTGRRRPLLDEVTRGRPGMMGLELDVRDPASVEALPARILRDLGGLDVLVNNAGLSRREALTADPVDLRAAEKIVETNILGVLRTTAALLPLLRQAPAATIVTTTSGLAFVPRAEYPSYCASKAFLHSWVQSLRVQLHGEGIEVLELVPPYVQTELGGPAQANDPAAMPLADYVAAVMRLLEAGEHPTGEVLVERVKPLRTAEADGRYAKSFALLNGR